MPDPWKPELPAHEYLGGGDTACMWRDGTADAEGVPCGYGVDHPIHDKPANLPDEPAEVRKFYGPGAPRDALTASGGFCAPVTGVPMMFAPEPAKLLRQAADYLQACEGATLATLVPADGEGPLVFMGGSFPAGLRQCASWLEEKYREEGEARRAAEAERQRRLRHVRPVASLAYAALGRIGNLGEGLARRLDHTFDFQDEDFD